MFHYPRVTVISLSPNKAKNRLMKIWVTDPLKILCLGIQIHSTWAAKIQKTHSKFSIVHRHICLKISHHPIKRKVVPFSMNTQHSGLLSSLSKFTLYLYFIEKFYIISSGICAKSVKILTLSSSSKITISFLMVHLNSKHRENYQFNLKTLKYLIKRVYLTSNNINECFWLIFSTLQL